jgi:hypothetical protein
MHRARAAGDRRGLVKGVAIGSDAPTTPPGLAAQAPNDDTGGTNDANAPVAPSLIR